MTKDPEHLKAVGKFISALVLLAMFLVALGPGAALGSAPQGQTVVVPGRMIELRAGDTNAFTSVRPSPDYDYSASSVETANITVNYTGFTPEAQAAFEHAVNIWEAQLTSPVEIIVNASWEPLDEGVLGSAGPASLIANWEGPNPPPRQDVFYPLALANKWAAEDLSPENPDIVARFSSVFPNWYFGTDGNTPADTYDFVSVVLHELGHGLGFVGSARIQDGQGMLGFTPQGMDTPWPVIYDVFVETGEGQALWGFPNPSNELMSEFISDDLYIDSPTTVAVLGGGNRPKIYAPNEFQQGTSYSHWDEDAFPPGHRDSLMTGFLDTAEGIHDPGPLTRGLFQDMGWSLETPLAVTVDSYSATPATNPVGWLAGVTLLGSLGALAMWRRKRS